MLVRFMWLLRRLSVMSGAEIVYRLRQQGTVMSMRLAYRGIGRKKPRIKDPKSLAFCAAADPQLPELPWDEDFSADEERALLTGRWHALGCAWSWTPDPMVWHRAPDTNQLWPQRIFAAIDYRPGNPFGDARIVWEPSRLQQLVSLGLIARQAATRTAREGGGEGGRERGDGGERAADLLCRQLRSWVAANPPFHGIHYASAMECGLRILAVCHAMDFVRSSACARGTWPAVVNLVQSHADLIARRLSLYSSRGNHTVAEAAGLVYAGVLFPEMEGAERWRRTGLALLEAEADHQILEDGGGGEQAFWYLAFVLDLYGLVIRLMESRGCEVAFSIAAAFARGRAFLTTMAGPQGRIPPIGDGDDGFALSSRIRLWWDPGCRENRSGLESRSFQWSGYTVVIDHDAGPWVVVLDHGPLGMPPSYGHGHADALALTVAVGDREVLVDPGTYAYGREDGWRRYFSGTRAHNTVCVDGRDQARRRGPFLWAEPYSASLVRREEMAEGGVRLLAHHTRYGGTGVDHWRGVVYRSCRSRGTLMVWDCFKGEGVHELELNWHCNGEISEVGASKAMMLAELDATMTLTGGRISRHSGEVDPPRGWRAPGYGRRVPITTLTATATTLLPHEFLTIVALAPLNERTLANDVDIFRSWLP